MDRGRAEMKHIPVKRLSLLAEVGAALSMLALSFLLFTMTGQGWVLVTGVLLTACALAWLFLLTLFFAKRLSQFTSDLCRAMDSMISGSEEPARADDSETIFARISYRLSRLYGVLQENRRKVDEERRELQTLVSDISHQVKTPVSNLKMVTDTLLAKPVTEQERQEFLQGIRN
ncbi:MAG: sensor histidine kinase, partial [Oscillospiraceae bacterium]